jgi:[acyl-carrier-protein] S-malonyltransferase
MKKIALVFPGQGAQHVGMGKALYEAHAGCKYLFEQASEILNVDLARICFEGPEEELTRSDHAQPAIFVVSAAALLELKEKKPDMTIVAAAGLSSGEWAALYAAGVVGFEDTLRVLEARGRYMQQACQQKPGAMLSVLGLTAEQLQPVAEQAGVSIANLNSPEQTVLSGTREGIDRAESLVKDAGAKRALRLNVAGAFHSPLMESAAQQLEQFLADLHLETPVFPVLSNVTGKPFNTTSEIREMMVKQVTHPVQWVEDVRGLLGLDVDALIECGPGKVLAGLVKRIDKQAVIHNIQDQATLDDTCSKL